MGARVSRQGTLEQPHTLRVLADVGAAGVELFHLVGGEVALGAGLRALDDHCVQLAQVHLASGEGTILSSRGIEFCFLHAKLVTKSGKEILVQKKIVLDDVVSPLAQCAKTETNRICVFLSGAGRGTLR